MFCPFCGHRDTRVIDTRVTDDGDSVKRRRTCQSCNERFTTFEHAQLRLPQVAKSDGRLEAFDEVKLRGGMLRALQKRPVEADDVEAAVQRVMRQVVATGDRQVTANRVGEFVIAQLRELDEVAYVRFASVYRRFQDIDAFSEEVERLQVEHSSADQGQMTLLPGNDSDNDEGQPADASKRPRASAKSNTPRNRKPESTKR